MSRLDFLQRYYPCPQAWRQWYKELLICRHSHASYLIHLLCCADNVHLAGEYLKAAMSEDLIIQTDFWLSPEQSFFGMGGVAGNNPHMAVYPQCYYYSPKSEGGTLAA